MTYFSSRMVTTKKNFTMLCSHTLNNTRHASAGFDLICAPRRVTFLGGLVMKYTKPPLSFEAQKE